MEDGSPYARTGKPNAPAASGQRRAGGRGAVEDLGDEVWNFTSFCTKAFVKDSVPDKQLSLQELALRYAGEFTGPRAQGPRGPFPKKVTNAVAAGTKTSVLRTIAQMDLDKINMDLVEKLLEWIVEGNHRYPPGTPPAQPGAGKWAAGEPFEPFALAVQVLSWCFCRAWPR